MIFQPDLSQSLKKAEKPKRMLELSKLPDGRDLVYINFSSLSLINDCMRKALYALINGYRSDIEADALSFGKAIHKGLEHWYTLPANLRQLSVEEDDLVNALISSPLSEPSLPYETALDSINEFVKAAQGLRWLGAEDKRSINNGIKILKAYFKHYAEDGLEVLRDSEGKALIEKEVEFKMHEDSEKVIFFHGTIDIILKNTISGQIFVADHKTTAALGSSFYNRINPNHQYTGYVWAARECLGINTNSFLVNGIQVAKTKSEFARQPTQRNEEDFAELRLAVIDTVERILKAKANGVYPMNAPNACNTYGSCQYLDVCSAPSSIRESVLRIKYNVN